MELTAYLLDGHDVSLQPAPVERDWMSGTDQRFAYRCLPLAIANSYGWQLLCPVGFSASWRDGSSLDAIEIEPDDPERRPVLSHFGAGVLTFHVPCLFRTEPGHDLFVTGPTNAPKDGIYPLTGVIETDWSPYSFTMNWVFTRPGARIRFEAGEPFCQIFPVKRGAIEEVEPRLKPLSDNPELSALHKRFTASRAGFNADLREEGSAARAQGWQRSYFHGVNPDGTKPAADHRVRLRAKSFV